MTTYPETLSTKVNLTELRNSDYLARQEMLRDNRVPEVLFNVTCGWRGILEPIIKDVSIQETLLPYDCCAFTLLYMKYPSTVVVEKHDQSDLWFIRRTLPYYSETEVLSENIEDGKLASIDTETMIEEIKYILIALESKAAVSDFQKVSKKTLKEVEDGAAKKEPKDTFRVYTIGLPVSTNKPHDGQTTGRRQRFHFRRGHFRNGRGRTIRVSWYFAGDITLGVADKSYKITEKLKTNRE